MIRSHAHHIVFLDVDPRQTIDLYAAAYLKAHAPHHSRIDTSAARLATLSVVDRSKALAAYSPAARGELLTRERCLLDTLARDWPVPAGESVIDTRVEVLAASFGDCPAGTVAAVRRTSAATVALLFPGVTVDIATGVLSQPERRPLSKVVKPVVLDVGSGSGSEVAQLALRTASTLAFALPMPWGALCAAGLGLIAGLLPQDHVDLVGNVVKALEAEKKQDALADGVRAAQQFMQFCDGHLSAMKLVDPPVSEVIDTILPGVERNLTPDHKTLYNILWDLSDDAHLINTKGGLDTMLLCVSSYLYGMRFRILLDAYVSKALNDSADKKGASEWDARWRYDYVLFEQAIMGSDAPGWVARMSHAIDSLIANRLAAISAAQRVQLPDRCVYGGNGSFYTVPGPSGWTFIDTYLNEDASVHFVQDSGDKGQDQHQDQVVAARNAYAQGVANALDIYYATQRQTVVKWRDSINEWNEHLKPSPPKTAPAFNGAWAGVADAEPWIGAKSVAYAVAFQNGQGEAKGPWSAAVDPKGQKGPSLKDIPVDSTGMATKRVIYRSIDGAEKPVGLINDNVTTTFADTK